MANSLNLDVNSLQDYAATNNLAAEVCNNDVYTRNKHIFGSIGSGAFVAVGVIGSVAAGIFLATATSKAALFSGAISSAIFGGGTLASAGILVYNVKKAMEFQKHHKNNSTQPVSSNQKFQEILETNQRILNAEKQILSKKQAEIRQLTSVSHSIRMDQEKSEDESSKTSSSASTSKTNSTQNSDSED